MVESITFLNPWLTSHGLSKTLPSLFMHFPYFYLPIYNHLDMCEMYHFTYMSSFKMYIKLYAHIFNLYKFNLLSILGFFFTSFIQHHFFRTMHTAVCTSNSLLSTHKQSSKCIHHMYLSGPLLTTNLICL